MTALQVFTVAGYELGAGRAVPTTAALLGLASVGLGIRSLVRTRRGAAAAVTLGLIAVAVGGVHGLNAQGGLGTGNGLAGAIFAVLLGVAGTVLGGLAVRARRAGAVDG